ncbi:hypothetical protein BHM03_00011454 [Ensete ventricosum]|nr:hypothetical protein BHM03_00011454 [Ensete ventricosum]
MHGVCTLFFVRAPPSAPSLATFRHLPPCHTSDAADLRGLMSHNSKLLYRYNFSKVAQYKQLTLEEAEEKMNKRRHNATGYERWMMKAATNGAAAFGEVKKNEDASKGEADGSNRLKKGKSSDDGEHSDKGEENEDEEEARKNRLGPSKKGVDDDEEGAKGAEFDLDDDDVEKGDDWEHEETFTDDDEAVGNDPEEREDLAPEIPAPPEIKQDDEEEDEEDGGLSKSGKELKKLLGRAAGLNESDGEEEDDDDDVSDPFPFCIAFLTSIFLSFGLYESVVARLAGWRGIRAPRRLSAVRARYEVTAVAVSYGIVIFVLSWKLQLSDWSIRRRRKRRRRRKKKKRRTKPSSL